MKLDINLDEVPDKILPVDSGQYDCTIKEVKDTEATGTRKRSFDFVFVITTDGPMKGRQVRDGFPPEFLVDLKGASAVKLGHLIRSAGMKLSGSSVDFDEFIGKSVRLTVVHKIGKGNDGSQETFANIGDYIYSKD